jgi:hypothetical protein
VSTPRFMRQIPRVTHTFPMIPILCSHQQGARNITKRQQHTGVYNRFYSVQSVKYYNVRRRTEGWVTWTYGAGHIEKESRQCHASLTRSETNAGYGIARAHVLVTAFVSTVRRTKRSSAKLVNRLPFTRACLNYDYHVR